LLWLAGAALVVAILARPAAAQRSWDDNGNDASKEWSVFNNWNPNGTPEGEPIAIGDVANAANDATLVDQNFTITSLTVSNGADVFTSGNELIVNGVTTIGGAGVNFYVNPRSAGDQDGLDSQGIVVNDDANLQVTGESDSTAGGIVELESGLFEINVGGNAGGHGTIQLIEAVAGQVMENSGRLFVFGRPAGVIGRSPGTLTITGAGLGTGTLDLDGDNDSGFVDVDDGFALFESTALALIIEMPLADNFSGQMDIGTSDTVKITNSWSMDDDGILNFTGGTGALAGGMLTVNGTAARVNLNGTTAVFQNNLTFTDGDFHFNSGTVQFDGTTRFPDATDFVVDANFFDDLHPDTIRVNSVVDIGDLTVSADEDFYWDSADETIVNAGGDLSINVEHLRPGIVEPDTYRATLTLNSGNVDVRVADGEWVLDGVLNLNNSAADIPLLSGDTIEIGPDFAFGTSGDVIVGGAGTSQISAPVIFTAGANLSVAATAVLVTGNVTFQSVNGNSNAEFTGSGTWRLAGTNTVSETTTINMTGGTVDLDNSEVTALIADNTNVDAPLTVNAATFANYGSSKTFMGNTTLSNLNVDSDGATGSLTVNLDAPHAEWTVAPAGIVNLTNDNIAATLLAGSDVNLNGTVNVAGNVRTDARVDIGGTINILTAGSTLRLSGGDQVSDPNTIVGGTVNGPGLLLVEPGSALVGFGTIDADVDCDGSADLWADDGTLSISPGKQIFDVDQLGTADDDGILDVGTVWNTNVASFVVLNGGELTGRPLTNDGINGIKGFGLLSAPVNNNSRIDAVGGTLVVDVSDNLWDGQARTGQLNAASGDLEVRDNANYSFAGTIRADVGRTVFANGFDFLFEPGSTLHLTNGTYRSLGNQGFPLSGDFGGTIVVNPGGQSRLEMFGGAEFLGSSTTTLNDNLVLDNAVTFIRVGAEFTGSGSLINLPQSSLVLEDGVTSADLGVLIHNRGSFGLGATPQLVFVGAAAQISATAFQQSGGGSFNIDLGGAGLDEFDRLELTGSATLDGTLRLRLFNAYVPTLGDTFNILSAAGGVAGSFATIVQPNEMPMGLVFDVLYSPTLVRLVLMPELLGDYNLNGVVDAADYAVWRDTLGAVVTAFSGADGDGNGTVEAGDYDIWRAHFGQTAGDDPAVATGQAATNVPEAHGLLMFLQVVGSVLYRLRCKRASIY
jgi:hypothetical protein